MRYRTALVTVTAMLAAVVPMPARQAPPAKNSSTCSLSADGLARIRAFALASAQVNTIPAHIAPLFGLRVRAEAIPAKQVFHSAGPELRYFVSFPLENPEDVFFLVQSPGTVNAYFTDTTLLLRAAAVGTAERWQLTGAATAQPGFEAALRMWAGLAAREPKLGGNPKATGC